MSEQAPPRGRESWRYQPGGPLVSESVRRGMEANRERWWVNFRRDPGREIALLILGMGALATLLALSAALRHHHFELSGLGPSDTFWMESAQRFRTVGQAIAGGIPLRDPQLQAPDGYAPWADTVLQEWLYGRLFLAFGGSEQALAPFVRELSRWFATSTLIPLAALLWILFRRRDAALAGAALYAFALPMVERGTGQVIYREDLAFPILVAHLACLAAWIRRPRLPSALLAGLFLAAALLLWKVVTLFLLLETALFVALLLWGAEPQEEGRDRAIGGLVLFLPVAGAALLPFNLQHDHFLSSTPFLLWASVGAALLLRQGLGRGSPALWVLAALGVAGGLRAVLPVELGLGHAWDTLLARLQFPMGKPLDPSLLSFHARHYWTGNYESPGLARLLRDWALPAIVAVPGVLMFLSAGWRKLRRHDETWLPGPYPARLFEGLGPPAPLSSSVLLFCVWLVCGFAGLYLVFRKFVLFAGVAAALLCSFGFAAPERMRGFVRAGILGGLGVVAVAGWAQIPALGGHFRVPTLERIVAGAGAEAEAWDPVDVFSPDDFDALARWMAEGTAEGDTVLASFVVSPFFATYCNRRVALHCFFEGDLLPRLEAVSMARFGDEVGLWKLAGEYGAKWYVHEAHHLLRSDPKMSARYVAGRLEWPQDAVLVRMQYAPEMLEHFELAWEGEAFRVFRVLEEGEEPQAPVLSARPLWSRSLFAALFGDPLQPLAPPAESQYLDPHHLLVATLKGRQLAAMAANWQDRSSDEWAERSFQEALRIAPFLVPADQALAALYAARGIAARADFHRLRSDQMARALRGGGEFPPEFRPVRSPIRGEQQPAPAASTALQDGEPAAAQPADSAAPKSGDPGAAHSN